MSVSYDTDKYFLGRLCSNGHDYEGSGKSLRYKSARKKCVQCRRNSSARDRAKLKERKSNLTEEQRALVITEGRNPNQHYLGNLCAKNHDWQNTGQSLRLINNGACAYCTKAATDARYNKNRDQVNAERRAKYANDEEYRKYMKERARSWRNENLEYARALGQKYRDSRSPEQLLQAKEYRKRYRQKNYQKQWWDVRQAQLNKRFGDRRIPYTHEDMLEKLRIFGDVCAYCSAEFDPESCRSGSALSWDHVLAETSGGWDTLNNVVPCCISCNASKGNRPMEEWYQKQPFFQKARLDLIKQTTRRTFNEKA